MNTRKVHIKSFGCQMNKLDTALVVGALEEAGWEVVERVKEADLVLINTCSVREHAEDRVLSHLGHLKHIKREKPALTVGVIGCMAQRLGEKLLEHDVVDIVCGPGRIPQIPQLVEEAIEKREKELAVVEKIRAKDDPRTAEALEQFETAYGVSEERIPGQAFVRAMRGCNNFCTYCIVPYVRGPEVSRPPEAILEQVKRLAGAGIKQITLLGQTVNSYEYSAGGKTWSLADLLAMVAQVEGIEWVRFVTSYPERKHYREILQAIADIDKVCRYLHMPAQSGSDRVLKAMNRRYISAEYLDMLAEAREVVPGISLAGDFIVGFAGETDSEFAETAELVRAARYRNCYVFKYSPRPGTRAEKGLEDSISDEVKQQRNVELLAVQEQISGELAAEFQDKTVRVLVEGLSKKPDEGREETGQPQLIGRTEGDWIVVFNGPESLAGSFADVQVIKTSPLTLFGIREVG